VNENEVLSVIKNWMRANKREEELHIWEDDDHTIEEAYTTYMRASIIIGLHGGANLNVLFSPPNRCTSLVEFIPAEVFEYSCFPHVAKGSNVSYFPVLLPNARYHQNKVEVDVNQVSLVLDTVHDFQVREGCI